MINNIVKPTINYDDNVLNINSEKFYRQAEDNFYYFKKPKKAIALLNKAIDLTPTHCKSIKMKGDIYYSLGDMENAFDCYSTVAALKPSDAGYLASVAICLEAMKKYEIALSFIDNALSKLDYDTMILFPAMCELKVKLLVSLKRSYEAYLFISANKKRVSYDDYERINKYVSSELQKRQNIKNRIVSLKMKIV